MILVLALLLLIPRATFAAPPASPQQWLETVFAGRDPEAMAIVKAHPRLADAATKYLVYCGKNADWRCALDQYDFVLHYIRAFYGHPDSEFVLATVLSGSGVLIPAHSFVQPGVHRDPIEGCAWAFVLTFQNASEPMDAALGCADLPAATVGGARWRADQLLAQIAAHVARKNGPPAGFADF